MRTIQAARRRPRPASDEEDGAIQPARQRPRPASDEEDGETSPNSDGSDHAAGVLPATPSQGQRMRNWPRRPERRYWPPRDIEVYIGDIICFVKDHDYDLEELDLFFDIGRVVGFDPMHSFVTVDKFHCSTDLWEEALGSDLTSYKYEEVSATATTDVRYSEYCPQCCNQHIVFRDNVSLRDIAMTAIEFEGEQMNELHHEEREELTYLLGAADYYEQMLEYDDYEHEHRNRPYFRNTFVFAQSLNPRPLISTQAAPTSDDEDMPELITPTFRHMDENCDQQDES